MYSREKITRRFVSLVIFFWAFAFALGSAAQSSAPPVAPKHEPITQDGGTIHLIVNGARPLADALDALQTKYGWRINYEDPQFLSKLDVSESTDMRYANAASGARPHMPNGASFGVDFPAGPGSNPPEAASTIKIVIEAYNKSSNPGQFELRAQDQRFDVVGIASHDEAGKMQTRHPPLDDLVTVASAEQPGVETVTSICEQLSKHGAKVNLGVYPRNALGRPVTVSANNLPARDALARIASAVFSDGGKTISWRLLFDPDSKSYFMNLHIEK